MSSFQQPIILKYCRSAIKLQHQVSFLKLLGRSPIEWNPETGHLEPETDSGKTLSWKLIHLVAIFSFAIFEPFLVIPWAKGELGPIQTVIWFAALSSIGLHLICAKRFLTGTAELASAVNKLLDLEMEMVESKQMDNI